MQRATVSGTSLLGVVYNEGVLLVGDTILSYGSLAKFTGVSRFHKLGNTTVMGSSGDYGDFQSLCEEFTRVRKVSELEGSGKELNTAEWHSYLGVFMHYFRNKMKPYLNALLVAGYDESTNKPFLGYVDYFGTTYKDVVASTGFGSHMGIPILRKRAREDMTLDEATTLLMDCCRVLWYRDCKASDYIQFVRVTKDGCDFSRCVQLSECKWDYKLWVTPTTELNSMLAASW